MWNPLKRLARVPALRSRRFWLRTLCVGFVLLGLCLLARNPISRRMGMIAGSYLLNAHVDIGKLDIRWSQIVVGDLTVFEPALPGQVQFYVNRITITPSLWRGVSEGVWIERIAIEQPVLHLRFDEQGGLLSKFPESSGDNNSQGVGTIPLQHLSVRNAGLIVQQVGRTDWRVENIDFSAEFSDSIVARARVPSILDGQIDFQCHLDAKTFAGTTRLNVLGVELDTQQLARFPLIPKTLGDEPATASFAMSVQGTHPPSDLDLRHHALACVISTRDVHTQRFGTLCPRLDVEVNQIKGVARIITHADPLGGEFRLQASADFNQPAIMGEMKITLASCELGRVTQHLPELTELDAIAMGQASANVIWHDGKLDFQGDAKAELQQAEFDSIALPSVTAQASTHGMFSIAAENPLQGVLNGSFSTTELQLRELATRFELPKIVGEVLASGNFELPLERLSDPASYRAKAHVQLRDIAGVQMNIPNSEVSATLRDGVATVDASELSLRDVNGKSIVDVKAQAVASLGDHGRLDTNAEVRLEPTPELINTWGLSDVQPRGRLSCRINAGCLLNELVSPRAWTVTAAVESQSVAIAGEEISDIQLHAKLSEGLLTSSPLVVKWRDNTCTIQTEGEVNDAISVHGSISAQRWNLQDVSEVLSRFSTSPLPVGGVANVDGQLMYRQDLTSGTRTLHAFGNATLEHAVFSRTRIGNARLRWLANLDGLVLSTSSEDFFGGRFEVYARMAELDWTKTAIDGTFTEVQVPRLVSLTRQRVPSSGILEGGFRVTSIASLKDLTGDAWMRSRQLTVQRVPLELAQTHLSVQQGIVSAGGDGQIADGRFSTTATASLPELAEFLTQPNPPLAQTPITAQFRLDSMPIAPVALALQLPREMRFAGGTVSTEILRDETAWDGRHLATMTASVDNVRWKHAQLSDRITANLVVHPTQVELNSVQGRFADGSLSGKAFVQFAGTPTGRFDFVASRVNLRRATSPFSDADISGSGTVKLRGRLGNVITGRADVAVENAVAVGVDVRQIRLPIDWTVTPAAKTVRWQCRAGTVSVGGGNVRLATQGSYANSLNMNTTVKVERVDLSKLMQHGSAGSGIVDGEVIVRAKQARSPQQFVGTYRFEMKNIQALEIPVLKQLPKMISLSPPMPGRGHDGATIHGRIGGGLLHVDEIAIHQSNVQLLVSGKATMQGKLDLDVIVSTKSTSPTDQLVSMLDSPLMLAAPAPLALIAKANELLKDRVVRVHVGGTAGYPTLRLQPGKQLTQEAVRFFLTNSFGSTATQVSNLRSTSQLR